MPEATYRPALSGLFPEVVGPEFDELVESMKTNGFLPQFPIVRRGDEIIDGWHRYKAALAAGVVPVFTEWAGEEAQAVQFVLAANAHRRHLTKYQKVQAILSLTPDANDKQVALASGASTREVKRGRKLRADAPNLAEEVKTGQRSARSASIETGATRPDDGTTVGGKHSMTFSAHRTKQIAEIAQTRGKELTGIVNEAVDDYVRAYKRTEKRAA